MKYVYLLPFILLLNALPATAAIPESSQFTLSASVAQNCSIITAPGMAFGSYSSISTNRVQDKDAQSYIAIRCTKGTATAALQLDGGVSPQASCSSGVTSRKLGLGETSNYLDYEMYMDQERTLVWGCEASNQYLLPVFTNSTENVKINIYGRISSGQTVFAGQYMDTVTASVVF